MKYFKILFFSILLTSCNSDSGPDTDIDNDSIKDLRKKITRLSLENKNLTDQLSNSIEQNIIAENTIHECNEKVKELDTYIDDQKTVYEARLALREEHIKVLGEYTDSIEKYAVENDANSFLNRNKGLIGFIGGALFCAGSVWGAGQLR